MLHEDTFDFSFSGLKTAVRRIVEGQSRTVLNKGQIAREFEDAVTDVLVGKTLRAAGEYGVGTVVMGGGVSANTHIRSELARNLSTIDCRPTCLPSATSTDNAVMIALAGYFPCAQQRICRSCLPARRLGTRNSLNNL